LDENQNETKVSNRDLDAEKEIDELLGTEESVSSSEEDTQNEGEENDEDKDVVDEQKHSELLRAISSSLQTRPKKKQKIVEISSAREESEFNLRVGHLTQTPSNNGSLFSLSLSLFLSFSFSFLLFFILHVSTSPN
jgi:hypothetical protein